MNKKDIAKVRKAILKHGDDFWTKKDDGEQTDTNDVLFYDILSYLKKEGLDLKLITSAA